MEKSVMTTCTPSLLEDLIDVYASPEKEHVQGETLSEIEELVTKTLQELRREVEAKRKLAK